MKKIGIVFFLITFIWAKNLAQSPIAEILREEEIFATDAQNMGMKAAYLKRLAPGAVSFDGGRVVNAVEFWQKADFPGIYKWQSQYAEVAASGTLAYTYGPFQFFENNSDKLPAYKGYYATIWEKNPEGQWKIVLDMGSGATDSVKSSTKSFMPKLSKAKVDTTQLAVTIFTVDLILSNRLYKNQKTQGSYAPGAPKIKNASQVFSPVKAHADTVGQLVYVYGKLQKDEKNHNYLRIWRKVKRKEWQVVFEMSSE